MGRGDISAFIIGKENRANGLRLWKLPNSFGFLLKIFQTFWYGGIDQTIKIIRKKEVSISITITVSCNI